MQIKGAHYVIGMKFRCGMNINGDPGIVPPLLSHGDNEGDLFDFTGQPKRSGSYYFEFPLPWAIVN